MINSNLLLAGVSSV